MTILEGSKRIFYSQFYDVLLPHFGKIDICTSDTDSLVMQVNRNEKEILTDLWKLRKHMDFSNLPTR